jgi:hypothetical protein
MTLLQDLESMRRAIKYDEESCLQDEQFLERVKALLMRSSSALEQAGHFQMPTKFSLQAYDPGEEERYAPTHILKIEVGIYDTDDLAGVVGWVLGIEDTHW